MGAVSWHIKMTFTVHNGQGGVKIVFFPAKIESEVLVSKTSPYAERKQRRVLLPMVHSSNPEIQNDTICHILYLRN